MMDTSWGIVEVSGTDARALLQGQLTQDMAAVAAARSPLAAWCSPKGRALTVCRVLQVDDSRFLLLMAADTLQPVAQRLGVFVLRADARVRARDEDWRCGVLAPGDAARVAGTLGLAVPAGPDGSANDGHCWLSGLPAGMPGVELAGPVARLQALDLPADFARRRLDLGLAALTRAVQDVFLPQMLNLDLLNAVHFRKGCYVGQEIVARTQNLGRVKRRMLPLAATDEAPVAPGDTVYAEGAAAGQVVAAEPPSLLAVLPLAQFRARLALDPEGTRPLQRLPLPYPIPDDPADA